MTDVKALADWLQFPPRGLEFRGRPRSGSGFSGAGPSDRCAGLLIVE